MDLESSDAASTRRKYTLKPLKKPADSRDKPSPLDCPAGISHLLDSRDPHLPNSTTQDAPRFASRSAHNKDSGGTEWTNPGGLPCFPAVSRAKLFANPLDPMEVSAVGASACNTSNESSGSALLSASLYSNAAANIALNSVVTAQMRGSSWFLRGW